MPYQATGAPARFAVLDALDRMVCKLVITYEAARDGRVTYDALYHADLPGNLRQAIADGRNVWVLSDGVEVRAE